MTKRERDMTWRYSSSKKLKSSGLERKVKTKFTEFNDAMREYHEVFGHELPPLPQEPVLSDYYTPSNEQHDRELAFITLSMFGIGGVLYYFEH